MSLGTDGLTCNDALDPFEVAKSAAMLSCIASTDPESWLTPREVLTMGSLAGARANLFDTVGRIAPGQRADIVLIDPTSFALVPRNDAAAQTVFSVRTRDVKHVFVEGELVVENGECKTVDVRSVNERTAAAAERYWPEAERSIVENLGLLPGVEQAYADAVDDLRRDRLYRLVPPVPHPSTARDGT